MQGAGGIGGLLAVHDHVAGKTYYPSFDGNGNLTALLDADSQAVVATYEYGPYGQLLTTTGDPTLCPLRFSTKYFDHEVGLYYFGLRYYSPSMGRWLNRDPIQEAGGYNLYAYASNDPTNRIDPIGAADVHGIGPNAQRAETGSIVSVNFATRKPSFWQTLFGGADRGYTHFNALVIWARGKQLLLMPDGNYYLADEVDRWLNAQGDRPLTQREILDEVIWARVFGPAEPPWRHLNDPVVQKAVFGVHRHLASRNAFPSVGNTRQEAQIPTMRAEAQAAAVGAIYDTAASGLTGGAGSSSGRQGARAGAGDLPTGGGGSISNGGGGGTKITVIGRMDDLKKFDADDSYDTWWKSGRMPTESNPSLPTWPENRRWLDARIERGDRFMIATDPESLGRKYIPGEPNGVFTWFELQYLKRRGVEVEYGF